MMNGFVKSPFSFLLILFGAFCAAAQSAPECALADAPRSGRPPKIDAQVEQALRESLEQPSPNLKALIAQEMQKKG